MEIIDLIYDEIDSMLKCGEFTQCNEIISRLNVSNMSLDGMLSYLTATLPAKSNLPCRSKFYHAVKDQLIKRKEYDSTLLAGLE